MVICPSNPRHKQRQGFHTIAAAGSMAPMISTMFPASASIPKVFGDVSAFSFDEALMQATGEEEDDGT